jgi:glycerol-3-phosphate dehydrogenase
MTVIRAGLADAPTEVDVLVVGLGVTGVGCALDAVARGLSVLAVDAHDLAFGTSRWSSKLVHGGLRYLAHGQIGVAHESAVERGILMEVTAPHLTHALPMLLPLDRSTGRRQAALLRAGFGAGDLLRVAARTSSETLPRPRRISATESHHLAPVLGDACRGGLLSWDGRLEDDARLVTTIARTAAGLGAEVRTRARAVDLHGSGAELRDELTGRSHTVSARVVVNAAGVWAGELVDDVELRPSRGTHLVLRADTLPGLGVALILPVPGERSSFVNVVPQPDGQVYVGLTDVAVDGDAPDVPEPTEVEIEFLLATTSSALAHPLTRAEVAGSYAGLRPLLRAEGRTAACPAATRCSPRGLVSSPWSAASSRRTAGWRRTPSTPPSAREGSTRVLPRPLDFPFWERRRGRSWPGSPPRRRPAGWSVASAPRLRSSSSRLVASPVWTSSSSSHRSPMRSR